MSAASATDPAPSTTADVLTSLKATATVTETSSTYSECVVGTATQMSTRTASVMTPKSLGVQMTPHATTMKRPLRMTAHVTTALVVAVAGRIQ